MLANYLRIAFRYLVRQKTYTLINIIGLTIGITSFLLIMLFVQYEWGFDRHISQSGRIFRVVEIQYEPGVGEQHVAITMFPLAPAMLSDFPEVQTATRMFPLGIWSVKYGNRKFNENYVYGADSTVFDLFDLKLSRGDRNTALNHTNSVVLTEKLAAKYFGSTANALGQVIEIGKEKCTVTGVLAKEDRNMHLRFEILIPIRLLKKEAPWIDTWGDNTLVTYVKLREHASYRTLEKKFPSFLKKHIDFGKDEYTSLKMYLQPLNEIHLRSGHIKFQINDQQGDIYITYTFLLIAFAILVIACINFINISISRSVKRSREVGVRKVLGASKRNLVYQFIGESVIITLISVLIALGLVEILLPTFNRILLTGLKIDFAGNWLFNIGLVLLLILLSLISGSYPSFHLSRFQPIQVLKGYVQTTRMAIRLRKGLVITQFGISIILIFSLIMVFRQVRFLKTKDLGYDYSNVLVVPFYEDKVNLKLKTLKAELEQIPGVEGVAAASGPNGASGSQGPIVSCDSLKQRCMVRYAMVDTNFFRLLRIPIVEGEDFPEAFSSRIPTAAILNEAAVREFGWKEPLGKKILPLGMDTMKPIPVVGVIRDYHYYSLKARIEPAVFFVDPRRFSHVLLKLKTSGIARTRHQVEASWQSVFPDIPFESYFASEEIGRLYLKEENALSIFTYFTILSMLISCLGLYGLTALITEQRTREIGIRKVMGGSVMQIVGLFTKDFLKLVFIAGIIALPLAWFSVGKALQVFAYRVEIRWYYYLLAVIAALMVASLTILLKAARAALANPVEALKYE